MTNTMPASKCNRNIEGCLILNDGGKGEAHVWKRDPKSGNWWCDNCYLYGGKGETVLFDCGCLRTKKAANPAATAPVEPVKDLAMEVAGRIVQSWSEECWPAPENGLSDLIADRIRPLLDKPGVTVGTLPDAGKSFTEGEMVADARKAMSEARAAWIENPDDKRPELMVISQAAAAFANSHGMTREDGRIEKVREAVRLFDECQYDSFQTVEFRRAFMDLLARVRGAVG